MFYLARSFDSFVFNFLKTIALTYEGTKFSNSKLIYPRLTKDHL